MLYRWIKYSVCCVGAAISIYEMDRINQTAIIIFICTITSRQSLILKNKKINAEYIYINICASFCKQLNKRDRILDNK